MGGGVSLSWNLVADVRQLVAYPFMVNALEAGTIAAVMAGCLGWFMVLRRQTFAGHTLSVTAFPGAAAAVLAGVSAAYGYFSVCALAAIAIAGASSAGSRGIRSYSDESAAIGSVQALVLALGFLFVSLYGGLLGGLDDLLFGTFLGIAQQQVLVLLGVAAGALLLLALIGRPLLFASVDPEVARAAGVPVRTLSLAFLVLLGLAVAATAQITGALLVFALLVMPAATAQLVTGRPALGLVLSVLLALAVTWVGLGIAYFSVYPIGFWITSLAFALYLLARVGRGLADRHGPWALAHAGRPRARVRA